MDKYFTLTLFLCVLVIYLILPTPKIAFRLNNNHHLKETNCGKLILFIIINDTIYSSCFNFWICNIQVFKK